MSDVVGSLYGPANADSTEWWFRHVRLRGRRPSPDRAQSKPTTHTHTHGETLGRFPEVVGI